MSFTDQELEELLNDLESDRVERKESFNGDAPTTTRQAICAFANDLPDHQQAGVVFVGARDDGQPVGLAVTDKLLINVANIKTDGRILPPPSMIVEKRYLKGADVIVACVIPADAPPVRFDGRIWIRIGPRRGTATRQDERILEEKRRYRDLPFDLQPIPTSVLKDIDRKYFESEYLPAVVAADVLAANDRTYEQRLASCRLIASVDEPTPTILGHLVSGVRTRDFLAGAYIQFLRIDGVNLASQIIDEETIDGTIGLVMRRIDEKLKAHNHIAVDIVSGDTERRRQPYPMAALQQLVRNAIMHRTYEDTNAPVRVHWFNDRIEIWNPGGPFGIVTADNFGEPGYTDYRNPHLAEALKALGFVQRFGVGIQTARAELRKNGNAEPEFQIEPVAINVIIRAAI